MSIHEDVIDRHAIAFFPSAQAAQGGGGVYTVTNVRIRAASKTDISPNDITSAKLLFQLGYLYVCEKEGSRERGLKKTRI